MIYTKDDFSNAYTELLEIFKFIPNKNIEKIPKEKMENYIKYKNDDYKFSYDIAVSFEEQNIMSLTKILLANLYTEYWADEERKKEIKAKDREEFLKIEEEKKQKYDIDNIFNKRKEKISIESKELVIIKEKNIVQKIIDKLKSLFKN